MKISNHCYEELLSDIADYIESDIDESADYWNPETEVWEYEKALSDAIVNPDADVWDFMERSEGLYGERGLTFYLKMIINEIEGIELTWADDYKCCNYLLLNQSYPWAIPEKERGLTENDVTELFGKYINIFTDEAIPVQYHDIENGG